MEARPGTHGVPETVTIGAVAADELFAERSHGRALLGDGRGECVRAALVAAERQGDHAVGPGGAGPQDVEVGQPSSQRLHAGGLEGQLGVVGAGQGEHGVAGCDQFGDGRADRRARRGDPEHFFRHFPDKRELLVAGQDTLSQLLAEGITGAPATASPLEAVAGGLQRAAREMGPLNREVGSRLKAAVTSSAELQERDALKGVGLAAAMTAALIARGVPDPTAQLAAELGVLAFKRGYAAWSEHDRDTDSELAPHTAAALDELRAASATLS